MEVGVTNLIRFLEKPPRSLDHNFSFEEGCGGILSIETFRAFKWFESQVLEFKYLALVAILIPQYL